MRSSTQLFVRWIFVLIFAFVIMACKNNNAQAANEMDQYSSELPTSLDNLFPPNVSHPIFINMMHGMSNALMGTLVDLFENDIDNALNNFESFKNQYQEIPKAIPEWADLFPIEPVDALNEALASGDQQRTMSAFENVGKVCHDCHIENMIPVQQKYHWGDFAGIIVQDPVQKTDVNFTGLMQGIELNFVGISNSLAQQQMDNAFSHLEGFKARFEAMEETCNACHDSERYYYVDNSVKTLIEQLENSMKKTPIDPSEIQMIGQKIGNESCHKCHLVHLPAAFSKH